jgi:hypothetical protein
MTKNQFRQRLWDMLLGAQGGWPLDDIESEDGNSVVSAVGLDVLGKWLAAIRREFFPDDFQDFTWQPHNLGAFDAQFPKIVDYLWERLPS